MHTIKTLLFDLDGTLLEIEMNIFIKEYIKELVPVVCPKYPPEKFAKILLGATKIMIEDKDKNRTNEEVFIENFFKMCDLPKKETMENFKIFYEKHFVKLKKLTNRIDIAKEIILIAKDSGFELVIATNPVFPFSAVQQRMEWAGVWGFDYKLITSYENMHFCKPNIEYYQEILTKIGRRGEDCLMIGNDVDEDLPASKLGIKTFLVKDYLLNRSQKEYLTDFQGHIKDLPDFIKKIANEV